MHRNLLVLTIITSWAFSITRVWGGMILIGLCLSPFYRLWIWIALAHSMKNICAITIVCCYYCCSQQISKQECIPVGCIPPAEVAVCLGGLRQCMLGYTPPGLGLDTIPRAWTPPRCGPADPPPARLPQPPPGSGPRHPPCGQNSWHTLLKILPCANFVAGGNKDFEFCMKR